MHDSTGSPRRSSPRPSTTSREQLDRLVFPGFVTATGAGRLADLLRYLAAVRHRLDRLPEDPERDRVLLRRVRALQAETRPATPLAWMVEELRVSLFAQHLGTAQRVSEQRVRRALAGEGSG